MVVSLGVSGLEAKIGKNIAFYQPMEGSGIKKIKYSSPSFLQFAAFLEKQGHSARYYIYMMDLLSALDSWDFDGVGISGTDCEIPSILEGAYRIKRKKPDLFIAVGGYAATGFGQGLIEHPAIDAVFEGYSEYTFSLFLKHLQLSPVTVSDAKEHYGRELDGYPYEKVFQSPISPENAKKIMGSGFKRKILTGEKETIVKVPFQSAWIKDSEGKIHHREKKEGKGHSPSSIQGELDAFVDLPWWGAYAEFTQGLGQSMMETGKRVSWGNTSIHAVRGCNGSCDFCSIPGNPITPSVDSVVNAIERTFLEYAHQTPARKPKSINLTCDSHTQDRKWTFELYTRLKEKGLTSLFQFGFQHKVWDMVKGGKVDTELLDLIADSYAFQAIGVETLHPGTVQARKKGADGEAYVRHAKEIIRESMRKNIPTTAYAITIHPESTPNTIASDYLAWAELANETYHETGRVFQLQANTELLPHIHTEATLKRMVHTRYNLAPTADVVNIRSGEVGCTFFPIRPEGKMYMGILLPRKFLFDKPCMDIYNLMQSSLGEGDNQLLNGMEEDESFFGQGRGKNRKEETLGHTDYIEFVGYILQQYGMMMNDQQLQEDGGRIMDLMKPVLNDSLGLRKERVKEGEKAFDDALISGSLLLSATGMKGRKSMDLIGILKTIMGDVYPVDPTPYEKTFYKIFSHRRWQTIFGPEDFWTMHRHLCGISQVLTSYTYGPDHEDTITRLGLAREGMKEYMHASAVTDPSLNYHLEHMVRAISEYPFYADQAREWIRTGPGNIFPGSFVSVDKKGDIIGHF